MVSFHLLQVPCPLLRLAFAIGLGFLLRSKCVSQIFDSSGSPAARSVVPLSLFFSFSSLFVYSIPAVLSASPRFLGTSALPSHSSHLTTAPGLALGRAYVGWLRRFASPAKDDSRTYSTRQPAYFFSTMITQLALCLKSFQWTLDTPVMSRLGIIRG